MRNTLLTTTALVLSAGIASADGHASISWSGKATAGVAREGGALKVAAVAAGAVSTAGKAVTATAASAGYYAGVIAELNVEVDSIKSLVDATIGANGATVTSTSVTNIRSDLVALAKVAAANLALHPAENAVKVAEITRAILVTNRTTDVIYGSVASAQGKAGNFASYSEVNATVTGSVTAGDLTLTGSMSVDAGKGYDFANDDGFDAAKTNGVGLDNVTIAGSFGSLKIDENAIAHLVDAGDDATADLLYTNTFGSISVSAAIDVSKDGDTKASKAVANSVTYTAHSTANLYGSTLLVVGAKAVAADVAWSAKVSMPVAGGTAYIAMDEEGGNAFGASTTLGGIGLTFASKLEALEEELSIDRDNTIGATYAMGATTLGATWNSLEDGDQWGISAAYAADGMALSASTDEGSDWSVSGSYLLGTGASVVGGINYTDDAYLGLSFSF